MGIFGASLTPHPQSYDCILQVLGCAKFKSPWGGGQVPPVRASNVIWVDGLWASPCKG